MNVNISVKTELLSEYLLFYLENIKSLLNVEIEKINDVSVLKIKPNKETISYIKEKLKSSIGEQNSSIVEGVILTLLLKEYTLVVSMLKDNIISNFIEKNDLHTNLSIEKMSSILEKLNGDLYV